MAELLDCGVDVDAIINHSSMSTGLIQSSTSKDLDVVRFLLSRGASADPVDFLGLPASANCWTMSDLTTKHSSMDVFNLLVESTFFDLDPSRTLFFASMNACGAQINSLVDFGGEVQDDAFIPIRGATSHGNYSAYLALMSHCDDNVVKDNPQFSQMLLETICGKVYYLSNTSEQCIDPQRVLGYDEIVIDMMQRGTDTRERQLMLGNAWIPPSLHGLEMTAHELAKALGPETEAWYLRVLLRCSLFTTREDTQRLRELTRAGYVVDGFVYDCGEEEDEADSNICGNCEESDGIANHGEERGELDIHTDMDNGPAWSASSEAQEDDQFWDAEEVV